MAVANLLDHYAQQGFCRVPPLVSADEVRTLQHECSRLLAERPRSRDEMLAFFEGGAWKSCTWTDPSHSTIHYDFIGASHPLDEILDRVLAHPTVTEFLTAALGTRYRMWYVQIRRANAGAAGRRMHVDEPGETTLSILVDDQPDKAGTTVFVPGSQFWPRVINSFPFVKAEHLSRHTVGATGKAGEMYFFSNGTWHGRAPNGDRAAATTILISFVPHGSKQETRRPPNETLNRLGPALRAVLEPTPPNAPAPTQPSTPALTDIALCRHHAPLLSPWRPIMAAAWASDTALRQWRAIKRWARQRKQTTASVRPPGGAPVAG